MKASEFKNKHYRIFYGKWRFTGCTLVGDENKFCPLRIDFQLMNPFHIGYSHSFWRHYFSLFVFVISWNRKDESE